MFQKSLLKNFVKSFKTPDYEKIYKFVKRDFIAEDANGAEFLALLGEFLNWNYKREVKNKIDSKKADGVIYDKNNPIGIIELKSSNKDISNPDIIAQAFRYKNEKPTCRYVFISNFKQIDIYIDSSDKCFSIDLSNRENYSILYALLNQGSLQTHQLAKLKENSKTQEEITKEVYKKYSEFRLNLIQNLIKNNPNLPKEKILDATNKLLDRFMFILFAEDRGLIPANTIFTIIKFYEENHKWGNETPLYEYYKKYFHFIDIGNKELNIPKYNGNLFKPDELVENLIIDDEVIKDDLAALSAYDFSLDADVEVLGHIFEQSLSDLEQIKEELIEGHKITDKRKKEGVNTNEINIAKKIKNNVKLSELSIFDARGGILQKYLKEEGDIKVLGGANIQRYEIKGVKGYINKNIKVSKNAFIAENSILLQRIIAHIKNPTDHIKITGTIAINDYYIVDTIYQVILRDNISNKYILALLHSNLLNWYVYRFIFAKAIRTFQFSADVIKNIPIPIIPKDLSTYIKNINYLINMPKKEKYDKLKQYAIAEIDGKKIYITEFLYAKNRGWIDDLVGHKEIVKEYLKIVPYLFSYNLFDEVLENIKDGRKIYVMRMEKYRFFHILDEKNYLISFFVMGELNFNKQLNKRFRYLNKPKWEGGHFSILSPARPFWRHLDLFNEVYQKIVKNSITQKDFIDLVDLILTSKEKIKKYKKHLNKLTPTEKIEVLEEVEKLETIVDEAILKIDETVYKIYNLTNKEIEIIKNSLKV